MKKNITIHRSRDYSFIYNIFINGNEYDFNEYDYLVFNIKDLGGNSVLRKSVNNSNIITLTNSETNITPDKYIYDLFLSNGNLKMQIIEESLFVVKEVLEI